MISQDHPRGRGTSHVRLWKSLSARRVVKGVQMKLVQRVGGGAAMCFLVVLGAGSGGDFDIQLAENFCQGLQKCLAALVEVQG